jgi:hypothetical protein
LTANASILRSGTRRSGAREQSFYLAQFVAQL